MTLKELKDNAVSMAFAHSRENKRYNKNDVNIVFVHDSVAFALPRYDVYEKSLEKLGFAFDPAMDMGWTN